MSQWILVIKSKYLDEEKAKKTVKFISYYKIEEFAELFASIEEPPISQSL